MQSEFNWKLFDAPYDHEEGPLRDYKEKFPNLTHFDDKAEFVRDIIALANTARMFGLPAYLIYGVRDRPREVCGIGDSLEKYRHSSNQGDLQLYEAIKRAVSDVLHEHVDPPPVHITTNFGSMGDKIVGYIVVPPDLGSKTVAFQVKKLINSRKHPLSKGLSLPTSLLVGTASAGKLVE